MHLGAIVIVIIYLCTYVFKIKKATALPGRRREEIKKWETIVATSATMRLTIMMWREKKEKTVCPFFFLLLGKKKNKKWEKERENMWTI